MKTATMGICLEILTYQVGTWAWTHIIGVMPVVKGQRPSPLGRPGTLNNTLVIIYRLKKLTSIVPKFPKNIMVVNKSHRHDTVIPQCFICYYPPTIILKYVWGKKRKSYVSGSVLDSLLWWMSCKYLKLIITFNLEGSSWLWSNGRWIYFSTCNQCLSPLTFGDWFRFIARCAQYNHMW